MQLATRSQSDTRERFFLERRSTVPKAASRGRMQRTAAPCPVVFNDGRGSDRGTPTDAPKQRAAARQPCRRGRQGRARVLPGSRGNFLYEPAFRKHARPSHSAQSRDASPRGKHRTLPFRSGSSGGRSPSRPTGRTSRTSRGPRGAAGLRRFARRFARRPRRR